MWWIQTTGYHVAGLVWLIVIAAIFLLAVIALGTAGAAAGSARRTRRMVREHETYHTAGTNAPGRQADTKTARMSDTHMSDTAVRHTNGAMVPPPPPTAQERDRTAETKSSAPDTSLGDSMRILHERYARGEITREEYLRAREDMMAMTR